MSLIHGPNCHWLEWADMRSVLDRFWSKVSLLSEDECWPFDACRDFRGYGRFSVGDGVVKWAHIVAYELVYGPVPDGKEVCHTCDNHPCCNYHHLYAGTHQQNMDDALRNGKVPLGFDRWNATKTDAEIKLILDDLKSSGLRQRDIAAKYGVRQSSISRWLTGARRG